MEEIGGGADRSRHHRNPPPSNRFIGAFSHQLPPTAPMHGLELSEHDIFNTPSDSSSSSSSTHSGSSPNRARTGQNHTTSHHGILAAINDNVRTRSGSDNLPVFNHKASAPVSLSSSSSTSPATSASSRMIIPRKPPPPPPVERMRLQHQSAPVNVPVMPAPLMRRELDLEIVVSEDDEEESNGVMLPPHEVVAARESPMLANSVLEGAGRTLKGRDLRQVRNAIWRKTGFLD